MRYNIQMRRLCLSVLVLSFALSFIAPAKADQLTFSIRPDDPYHGKPDPKTGLVYAPPVEPNFALVKFLKTTPPKTLQERIDRLVEGIKIDIPPEYDYYGYEIRRYMAHVGTGQVYMDSKTLADEQLNVKKAHIIFRFWQDYLTNEMKEIAAQIEKDKAPSNIRDAFKYNSGIVAAFEIECRAWLDNNEALLNFLAEDKDAYSFQDPKITFDAYGDEASFVSIFFAREKSRAQINKYHSFAGMIF